MQEPKPRALALSCTCSFPAELAYILSLLHRSILSTALSGRHSSLRHKCGLTVKNGLLTTCAIRRMGTLKWYPDNNTAIYDLSMTMAGTQKGCYSFSVFGIQARQPLATSGGDDGGTNINMMTAFNPAQYKDGSSMFISPGLFLNLASRANKESSYCLHGPGYQ